MSPTPHDAFARLTFQRPALAAEEIAHLLGPRGAALLDPGSLELVPGTFVAEDMRALETDILYRARLAGRPVLLYILLEHMSGPSRWMPLRLLRYMGEIWHTFVRTTPEAQELPVIIPMVLHHGEKVWPHPTAFEALFEIPADLRGELLPHVPRFCFALDDLAAQSDEDLRARPASAHLRVFLMALRSARSARTLAELFARLGDLVAALQRSEAGWIALRELFWYLFHARPRREAPDLKDIAAALRGSGQESLMESIADMYLEEGRQKGLLTGRQEGRQEGFLTGRRDALVRLLRARFGPLPAWVSVRVSECDEPKLDRCTDRIFAASSLDDVFA